VCSPASFRGDGVSSSRKFPTTHTLGQSLTLTLRSIPIIVVVFVIIGFFLPLKTPTSAVKSSALKPIFRLLQLVEILFLLSAVICLVLSLQLGSTGRYGWDDRRLIALYCIFAISLLSFGAVERTWIRKAASENQILPWRILLHQRSVALSALYSLCMGGVLSSILCWLPIWFQTVRQTTSFLAALYSLPVLGSMIIASIVSGVVTQTTGYYVPAMLLSPLLIITGSALMSNWNADMSLGACIGYQLLIGSGIGSSMQIPGLAVETVLDMENVSRGIRVIFTANALGSAVFLAVGQAVFASSIRTNLSPDIAAVVQAGGAADLVHSIPAGDLPAVLVAFNGALRNTLFVIVAVSAYALLLAIPVEWKSIKKMRSVEPATADDRAEHLRGVTAGIRSLKPDPGPPNVEASTTLSQRPVQEPIRDYPLLPPILPRELGVEPK